jgi:hypothetical protein
MNKKGENMTMTMTIWKEDFELYSGNFNGGDHFNRISKDTLLQKISEKIDQL